MPTKVFTYRLNNQSLKIDRSFSQMYIINRGDNSGYLKGFANVINKIDNSVLSSQPVEIAKGEVFDLLDVNGKTYDDNSVEIDATNTILDVVIIIE